jgi:hypothetical protein
MLFDNPPETPRDDLPEPKNRYRAVMVALALVGLLLAARQPFVHGTHYTFLDRDRVLSPAALAVLFWLFPQVWQNRSDDKFPIVVIGLAILCVGSEVLLLIKGAF